MGLERDLARGRALQRTTPVVEAAPETGPCELAAAFLGAVYSPELALYPYSTRLDGDSYVSTFADARAKRYTINSLLGLREAALSPEAPSVLAAVDDQIDAFRSRRGTPDNPGDRGLLLVLLAHRGDRDEITRGVSDVAACADARLNVQELAWMLWGASAAARTGAASAEPLARSLAASLLTRHLDPRAALARHAQKGYRRGVVSFGSSVYFLRALYEYGSTFQHDRSLDLFDRGVQAMIDIQGPLGEWPWLIDVASGAVVDPYPIFAVHQDSMAMLFLHPALDRDAPRAAEAIARSVAWMAGENEVATPMIRREPVVAYRSLERRDRAPRMRRYMRALRGPAKVKGWRHAVVRINRECRSYHLGWILYVWSSRAPVWSVDGVERRPDVAEAVG